MFPTEHAFFTSFFGILMAGGVPVPIYPPGQMARIEDHLRRQVSILKNSQTQILLTVPEALRLAPLLKSYLPSLQAVATIEQLLAVPPSLGRAEVQPGDLGLIQYTSGSTGDPKGVSLTHANLLANIRAMGEAIDASSRDVFVSWLPLYHDMGLIGAWLGSLYYGTQFVVLSPLSFIAQPKRWLQVIDRYKGTLSAAPNFAYELCASRLSDEDVKGLDLRSWRMAFNGAEPVSPDTIERFSQRFAAAGFKPEAMTPVYGLAENCVGLTFPPRERGPVMPFVERTALHTTGRVVRTAPGAPDAMRVVSCGRPLPGNEIRVVDDLNRECPDGQQGIIQFRGPCATSGYYKNPQADKKLFTADRWLSTGDYGFTDSGEIYISGRQKDMIIRAGRNIHPHEIEHEVQRLEGIRKGCVAVFGVQQNGLERLIVAAEISGKGTKSETDLKAEIGEAVQRIVGSAADHIELLPARSLPKTSSGKIRRKSAKDLFEKNELGKRKTVPLQFGSLTARAFPGALRRFSRQVSLSFYAAYAYAVFFFLAPVLWLLLLVLPELRQRRSAAKFCAGLLFRLTGIPLNISGSADWSRPLIVVSNHASYLDSFILAAALPPVFAFVAKSELKVSPVLTHALNRLGTLFVRRFDVKEGLADADILKEAASGSQSLIFFPEGTFQRASGLLPFRTGAFSTAAASGIPVLPVVITGSRSVLRGSTWLPRQGEIGVTIGNPIPPAGASWNEILKLRDESRRYILEHCQEHDAAR